VTPSEVGDDFGRIPPEVNEAGTAARTAVRDGVEPSVVVISVDWVAGAGRLSGIIQSKRGVRNKVGCP
jgi:hypothetical protein